MPSLSSHNLQKYDQNGIPIIDKVSPMTDLARTGKNTSKNSDDDSIYIWADPRYPPPRNYSHVEARNDDNLKHYENKKAGGNDDSSFDYYDYYKIAPECEDCYEESTTILTPIIEVGRGMLKRPTEPVVLKVTEILNTENENNQDNNDRNQLGLFIILLILLMITITVFCVNHAKMKSRNSQLSDIKITMPEKPETTEESNGSQEQSRFLLSTNNESTMTARIENHYEKYKNDVISSDYEKMIERKENINKQKMVKIEEIETIKSQQEVTKITEITKTAKFEHDTIHRNLTDLKNCPSGPQKLVNNSALLLNNSHSSDSMNWKLIKNEKNVIKINETSSSSSSSRSSAKNSKIKEVESSTIIRKMESQAPKNDFKIDLRFHDLHYVERSDGSQAEV